MITVSEMRQLYRHLSDPELDKPLVECQYAASQLLTFIHRGITDHTAHDIEHSKRVIENTNKIIELLEEIGHSFSRTEIRLLYMAGWLHDIGNLRKRTREIHSAESCRMIKRMRGRHLFLDSLESPLLYIVRSHQSDYNLEKVPEDPELIAGDEIRLRYISAIFRFADACDIGPDRAHGLAYFLLKDDFNDIAKKHWQANSSIISLNFDTRRKAVVMTVTSERKASFLIRQFKDDFRVTLPFLGDDFPLRKVIVRKARTYPMRS